MKKYILHILIMIAAVGFFVFNPNTTEAAACVRPTDNGTTIPTNIPQNQCFPPNSWDYNATPPPPSGKCFDLITNAPNNFAETPCRNDSTRKYWSVSGQPNLPPPYDPTAEVGNCTKTVPPTETLRFAQKECEYMAFNYPTQGWKWSKGPAPSIPVCVPPQTPDRYLCTAPPPSSGVGACYYTKADQFNKVGDLVNPPITLQQCKLNYNMDWDPNRTPPTSTPGNPPGTPPTTPPGTPPGTPPSTPPTTLPGVPSTSLPGTAAPSNFSTTIYTLLAPLPCLGGGSDCMNNELEIINLTGDNVLGRYLNLMLTIFIGLCAVLAVIMIVMGGIEYMTSELVSSKEAGKDQITNALFGLLIALGSFALLYTINPSLLRTDVQIDPTVIMTSDFIVSGALARSPNTTFAVKFDQAYSAAKAASQATQVEAALILAIFAQETNGGANTGRCVPANANMYDSDVNALTRIVGAANFATTGVSCPARGGRGGAIGLMQFRPDTWEKTRDNANRDPWDLNDALMVAAILLKNNGAGNGSTADAQKNAACRYYSGDVCTSGRRPPNVFYGDQVMAKAAIIRERILNGIADGSLK